MPISNAPDSDSRPILITGATGQVGSALLKLYPQALAPTRAELDLTSEPSIRAYIQHHRPSWIINPAAYTAVDKAESEPDLARAINADAPRILGEEAERLAIPVIHFSTDYVFDGSSPEPYRETDPTNPTSVYGATKLAGEQALAATGAVHLIFRTSWVYAATGKNFLLTVLRVAAQRPEMKIVDDQHGAPTWSHDLAMLAARVISECDSSLVQKSPAEEAQGFQGVYHASGAGETTWFRFAQEILRQYRHIDPNTPFAKLIPIPTSEYPTPARRPANSRLDCSKLQRRLNITLPAWQDSLARVLAQLPSTPAGK